MYILFFFPALHLIADLRSPAKLNQSRVLGGNNCASRECDTSKKMKIIHALLLGVSLRPGSMWDRQLTHGGGLELCDRAHGAAHWLSSADIASGECGSGKHFRFSFRAEVLLPSREFRMYDGGNAI